MGDGGARGWLGPVPRWRQRTGVSRQQGLQGGLGRRQGQMAAGNGFRREFQAEQRRLRDHDQGRGRRGQEAGGRHASLGGRKRSRLEAVVGGDHELEARRRSSGRRARADMRVPLRALA